LIVSVLLAGSWLEPTVLSHCRLVVWTGSDRYLHCGSLRPQSFFKFSANDPTMKGHHYRLVIRNQHWWADSEYQFYSSGK
jgi:hypothetical protein